MATGNDSGWSQAASRSNGPGRTDTMKGAVKPSPFSLC